MYRLALLSTFLSILLLIFIVKFTFFQEPFNVKEIVYGYEKDPFEKEFFSPCCCPSTYSSSQGCLCESPEIIALLASRGGNRMLDPL